MSSRIMNPNAEIGKVVVSVDFGATNSAVAWAFVPQGTSSETINPRNVRTISSYPSGIVTSKSDPMRLEVPTQLLYPEGWAFRSLDELRAAPLDNERHGHGDSHMNEGLQLLWGYQVLEETMQVTSHSDDGDTLMYGFKDLIDWPMDREPPPDRHVTRKLEYLSHKDPSGNNIGFHEMLLLVTIDFLTKLLKHAKRLIMEARLNITSSEIIICVPVIWSQRALRDIQTCMSIAAKLAGFPGVAHEDDCIATAFIVSEPEAAATWLLAHGSTIRRGDIFTILDAGGATCDALSYIVTRETPVRLERQPNPHSGNRYGSKALNEGFHRLLSNLLCEHTYLEKNGVTVAGITRKLVDHDFDKFKKPSWSPYGEEYDWHLEVMDIKFDPGDPNAGRDNNKKPKKNRVTIRAKRINDIFLHVCGEVAEMMREQLVTALESGIRSEKVVLMGGFAESRFLRRHLETSLAKINAEYGLKAEIYRPELEGRSLMDAVAAGGVLRALNKKNGPARFSRSSYGHGVYDIYDPYLHLGQETVLAHHNANVYVKTIRWVSKLNNVMPATFEVVEERMHTYAFSIRRRKNTGPFMCSDEVWVSDTAYLDHRSVTHKHNEGAEMLGIINTDITELFRPDLGERNPFTYRKATMQGKKRINAHWEFHYQLVFVIDGLNMRCFQRFDGIVLGELKIGCAPSLPSGAN
ncbi:Hsp70 chaperone protein [Fusarium heterosporum]|uniref:Hsp70 chaperone protein n=1 Tax=Fusarium heterosporum TaxID=42747 RepID=A0A8H5TVC6_FUSHE|nr:Hsp70 chaperone protein [Fusarium heterosporum]